MPTRPDVHAKCAFCLSVHLRRLKGTAGPELVWPGLKVRDPFGAGGLGRTKEATNPSPCLSLTDCPPRPGPLAADGAQSRGGGGGEAALPRWLREGAPRQTSR